MTKDNILFGIIGLLLGLIIGFMVTNSLNQRGYERRAQQTAGAQAPSGGPLSSAGGGLPGDHPQLPSNAVADQGRMPPEIQATIQKAKDEPRNFEAQARAAELYYQIKRFKEAIDYWGRANSIKPDDYETIVALGNANFDAENYDAAEKWYGQALAKKPDDVNVRTDLGLTFVFRKPENYERAIKEFRRSLDVNPRHEQTLQNITFALAQNGDRAEAQTMLKRLEEANPQNRAIEGLRSQIEQSGQ